MTLYGFLFYILAAVIVVSTGLAVTRRNLVHAVVYLVLSFFGSAMLFYLFGAPLLAALEVIIYAGAIMILFLFIIMMLKVGSLEERMFPLRQLLPAAGLTLIYLATAVMLGVADSVSGTRIDLKIAIARPKAFGQYLLQQHWLSIEIVSLLLLVALIGALHLGRGRSGGQKKKNKESI